MKIKFNLPISHHSEPPPNAAAQEERRAVKLKLTRELGNIKPDKPLDELGKERAKDKELSREELKAILEKTAEISKIFNSKRKIKYEVIEEADLVQIQVIDTDDGEIIRKIPADEIVELVKKLHEVLSERLDVKA